jgi:hypothetical protein
MKYGVFDQLARSTLLPEDMSAAILSGATPPLEEVVMNVLIAVLDIDAVVGSDTNSTWNERRIARACLAIAFLTAIAFTKEQETAQ